MGDNPLEPDLKAQIDGLAPPDYVVLSKPMELRPGQTLIGSWLDESAFLGSRITIYQEAGRVYVNNRYKDGSGRSEEVTASDSPRGRQFQTQKQRTGTSGERYVLLTDGNLELRDNDGPVFTAKRLKP